MKNFEKIHGYVAIGINKEISNICDIKKKNIFMNYLNEYLLAIKSKNYSSSSTKLPIKSRQTNLSEITLEKSLAILPDKKDTDSNQFNNPTPINKHSQFKKITKKEIDLVKKAVSIKIEEVKKEEVKIEEVKKEEEHKIRKKIKKATMNSTKNVLIKRNSIAGGPDRQEDPRPDHAAKIPDKTFQIIRSTLISHNENLNKQFLQTQKKQQLHHEKAEIKISKQNLINLNRVRSKEKIQPHISNSSQISINSMTFAANIDRDSTRLTENDIIEYQDPSMLIRAANDTMYNNNRSEKSISTFRNLEQDFMDKDFKKESLQDMLIIDEELGNKFPRIESIRYDQSNQKTYKSFISHSRRSMPGSIDGLRSPNPEEVNNEVDKIFVGNKNGHTKKDLNLNLKALGFTKPIEISSVIMNKTVTSKAFKKKVYATKDNSKNCEELTVTNIEETEGEKFQNRKNINVIVNSRMINDSIQINRLTAQKATVHPNPQDKSGDDVKRNYNRPNLDLNCQAETNYNSSRTPTNTINIEEHDSNIQNRSKSKSKGLNFSQSSSKIPGFIQSLRSKASKNHFDYKSQNQSIKKGNCNTLPSGNHELLYNISPLSQNLNISQNFKQKAKENFKPNKSFKKPFKNNTIENQLRQKLGIVGYLKSSILERNHQANFTRVINYHQENYSLEDSKCQACVKNQFLENDDKISPRDTQQNSLFFYSNKVRCEKHNNYEKTKNLYKTEKRLLKNCNSYGGKYSSQSGSLVVDQCQDIQVKKPISKRKMKAINDRNFIRQQIAEMTTKSKQNQDRLIIETAYDQKDLKQNNWLQKNMIRKTCNGATSNPNQNNHSSYKNLFFINKKDPRKVEYSMNNSQSDRFGLQVNNGISTPGTTQKVTNIINHQRNRSVDTRNFK